MVSQNIYEIYRGSLILAPLMTFWQYCRIFGVRGYFHHHLLYCRFEFSFTKQCESSNDLLSPLRDSNLKLTTLTCKIQHLFPHSHYCDMTFHPKGCIKYFIFQSLEI